jgi:hypothetical protein
MTSFATRLLKYKTIVIDAKSNARVSNNWYMSTRRSPTTVASWYRSCNKFKNMANHRPKLFKKLHQDSISMQTAFPNFKYSRVVWAAVAAKKKTASSCKRLVTCFTRNGSSKLEQYFTQTYLFAFRAVP